VTLAVGTLPKLESAFAASVLASGIRMPSPDDDAEKLAAQLRQTVPGPLLDQVRELSTKVGGKLGNGMISAWRTATDLTANRVGLICSNDFETAARAIATEGAALSSLSVKDRLRDLLAYAVSEPYFQVRRHLGIHVHDKVVA
jgi:hypothetical protein